METNPIPFLFEGENLVRVVLKETIPWFVAADVCRILGIKNAAQALESLDDDEKGICITYTLGGMQEVLAVTESGLYALIFRSRKPAAVRLRKWVTSEVLPSLRTTGTYSMSHPGEPPEAIKEREFPNWALDAWRIKLATTDRYDRNYGKMSAQWCMEQLGFPVPPKHLISEGRQLEMFVETISIIRESKPSEAA